MTATLPDFPVPDFDKVDAAFGARLSRYVRREQMPDEFYAMRHPMCKVAGSLFFNGGKLTDHGLRFRHGIDADKAYLALHALLRSFEPSHEIKIGTVGIALSQWCEPIKEAAHS